MSDFVEFAKNVEAQLATSNRAMRWEPGEAECYMTEVGARRDRFEALASRLNDSVIQPRLLTLASYFPNASSCCPLTMAANQLFSSLVRQYLFVALYRACAESLASENASRLAAMRGAEHRQTDH